MVMVTLWHRACKWSCKLVLKNLPLLFPSYFTVALYVNMFHTGVSSS